MADLNFTAFLSVVSLLILRREDLFQPRVAALDEVLVKPDALLLQLDVDRQVGLLKEVVDGQVGDVFAAAIRDQVPEEVETG